MNDLYDFVFNQHVNSLQILNKKQGNSLQKKNKNNFHSSYRQNYRRYNRDLENTESMIEIKDSAGDFKSLFANELSEEQTTLIVN